jgi:hypothetical protein
MAAFGAHRKHEALPTNFCSPPENLHSRYGHLTARFAPDRSFGAALANVRAEVVEA